MLTGKFKNQRVLHRGLLISVCLILLLTLTGQTSLVNAKFTLSPAYGQSHQVYLPIVLHNYRNGQPIILGVYAPTSYENQSAIDTELNSLSVWSGVKLTMAGTFLDISQSDYYTAINKQFDNLYNNGYTPFINLMTTRSAADIANGVLDNELRSWADAFKAYARNGARGAFIAPLPEMNGNLTSYAHNPGSFIQAYLHIQTIFSQRGVPAKSVKWVFAPDAYSEPPYSIADYYPGDAHVDVNGISAFNFGHCPGYIPWWISLEDKTEDTINYLKDMAPTKPVFITQTATTSNTGPGHDDNAKNTWIYEAYTYLPKMQGVHGVIYFNFDGSCDLAMYRTGATPYQQSYQGYKDAIASPDYDYISPDVLINTTLIP